MTTTTAPSPSAARLNLANLAQHYAGLRVTPAQFLKMEEVSAHGTQVLVGSAMGGTAFGPDHLAASADAAERLSLLSAEKADKFGEAVFSFLAEFWALSPEDRESGGPGAEALYCDERYNRLVFRAATSVETRLGLHGNWGSKEDPADVLRRACE